MERTGERTPDAGSIDQITSFDEDLAGELYIVDRDGEISRIVPEPTGLLLLLPALSWLSRRRRKPIAPPAPRAVH